VSDHGQLVFLGCYTGESGGEGDGIALLRRDPSTGRLTRLGVAARTPSPSFLAQHPSKPVLYAVNELDAGTVSAFTVAPDGSLSALAVQETGGRHPCHLAVTADGAHLVVANYSSGDVSVHKLDLDGAPGERTDLLALDGSGPVAERQDHSHAHMVLPDPNGSEVLIADLGADRVWRARLDPLSGRLTLGAPALTAARGTGLRHLLRAADGTLFATGELSGELLWHREGSFDGGCAASTAAGVNYPAELCAGRDGRFVYVVNRGPDTISAFAWDGEKATLIAEVPTGGAWPRHVALLFDHLYVANQRSHTVTTFRIDPDSGLPAFQGDPVAESSPACVLGWNAQHS
jgi:6-phosphogluconolactonase (cycloisomerase 2 family)